MPEHDTSMSHLLEQALEAMHQAELGGDSLVDGVTREFFTNNYREAAEGLLAKTDKLRVVPHGLPAPRRFSFEFDRPFKRRAPDGSLELAEGPIRGRIFYRGDLFSGSHHDRELPAVAVLVDPALAFEHPNVAREEGFVCLGDLPPGPISLEALLMYLITVLSYANYRCLDPLNRDAARLFATDPEEALRGLPPMEPLY